MRLLRTTFLCALLLASAGACADLTQPNTNQPDQSRVITDASDVETLIAGSYLTLFDGYTWQTDLALSTVAFQHSSMACCFGMIQLSRIPREPINNSTSDAYAATYQEIWYSSYAAIKAAVDGLNATHPLNPDGFRIIDDVTDADNTPRARAWARFTQGLGHGLLALTYDQAFVYDQGDDPVKLKLKPYNEVMVEALAQLDSAAAIAAANDFTIPEAWFGNVGMTRATFIKTINGYQAFLRANVARTPAQRNAVNWAAVIADVDASFQCTGPAACENLSIEADPNVWIHGTHYYIGFAMQNGAWAQVSNFVHGMADQSGGYQTWLNKQVLFRTPFLIVTPDLRFPQGATATAQAQNPGRYILYGGTRFDLERIGARAREVGAMFVIDATQSVGAMPFDLQRIQPDALVCATYKTMMGPYGLGVAWYGPRFDGGLPLEETWLGRLGSEDFAGLVDYEDEYQPGAARYDMGGRSSLVYMPMLIASLEMLLGWGPENVQAYCRALMTDAVAEARTLGYVVEDEARRGWHMFGLRLPERVDAARLQALLRERRVTVSLRGDAVRVAPNVYNEPADVAALLDALRIAAA